MCSKEEEYSRDDTIPLRHDSIQYEVLTLTELTIKVLLFYMPELLLIVTISHGGF